MTEERRQGVPADLAGMFILAPAFLAVNES
jgi:hypothetical protein